MITQPVVWYVVADGASARVLQRTGHVFVPVSEFVSAEAHQDARDLASDGLGRGFESVGFKSGDLKSGGASRHAIEPRSNPKQRAQLDFAHLIAGEINRGAVLDSFSQLVLVALPDTLHSIKEKLDPIAIFRLIAEESKDLIKLPEKELRDRLTLIG